MTSNPFHPLPPRALLRWDVVRRTVDELSPSSILEVGCGQGAMGSRLAARTSTYVAVEPDPQSFAIATERITPHGGTVINADHTAAPAGTYDLVCAFEVLEHLEDDRTALAEWAALVRPGGHLMLSVPAWQDRFGPMDTRVGHYRRYSPAELADVVEGVGLRNPSTTVYAWPLGYALEVVRNTVDAKFLARTPLTMDMAERTAGSGRHMQPGRRALGLAVQAATVPFALAQRLAPRRGTGLVTVARRPGGKA